MLAFGWLLLFLENARRKVLKIWGESHTDYSSLPITETNLYYKIRKTSYALYCYLSNLRLSIGCHPWVFTTLVLNHAIPVYVDWSVHVSALYNYVCGIT